jgi:hypothetical protein
MEKKKFWLGMLAVVLVFGMTVVGCGSGDGDDTTGSDTWFDVTSFSQVDGTWKAPATATATDQGMNITMRYNNYTITFNAASKTMSASGSSTATFSGGSINEGWSDLKEVMKEVYADLDGVSVTFNDATHSCTLTYNNFSQTMTDDDLAELSLKINQNGTKLKVALDGIELIYTKQ